MVVKNMVIQMPPFSKNQFLCIFLKNYGSILLPHGIKCDFFRFSMVRGMVQKSKKSENFYNYHNYASISLFKIVRIMVAFRPSTT
jgi:hypothetical protein